MCRTPRCDTASTTAFCTAAVAPVVHPHHVPGHGAAGLLRSFARAFAEMFAGAVHVFGEDVLRHRYRVLARVGVGGMGVIYRATDTVLDREVAVKVLHEKYGPKGLRSMTNHILKAYADYEESAQTA